MCDVEVFDYQLAALQSEFIRIFYTDKIPILFCAPDIYKNQ